MGSLQIHCMSLLLISNPDLDASYFCVHAAEFMYVSHLSISGGTHWPNYDLLTYARRLRTPFEAVPVTWCSHSQIPTTVRNTLLSHCSPTPDDVHNTSIKVRSTLSSQFCLHSEPPDQSTQHFVKSFFFTRGDVHSAWTKVRNTLISHLLHQIYVSMSATLCEVTFGLHMVTRTVHEPKYATHC